MGGGLAAVYFLGVTGFSGAGIVSGLAAIGAFLGGGMVVGIGVVAAVPLVLSGTGGRIGKWLDQKTFERERYNLRKVADAQRQPGLGSLIDKYRPPLPL